MSSRRVIAASWAGTAVFVPLVLVAVLVPGVRAVAAGVSALLFAIGVGVFFWAYAIAVGRSRTDEIGIGGLFFLAGDAAPPGPRRQLMASLALQTIAALGTASARPFTSLAFGVLAPLYGLATAGLWGARYGRFARRPDRRR